MTPCYPLTAVSQQYQAGEGLGEVFTTLAQGENDSGGVTSKPDGDKIHGMAKSVE